MLTRERFRNILKTLRFSHLFFIPLSAQNIKDMIVFPIAKINLGLNVVERRPDGYHNLETVFYPVAINDALEVQAMNEAFPSPYDCDLKVSNLQIEGDEQRNLVVRAYELLKHDFPALPRIHTHLYKAIPTQAGMGGGSSDCAYMIMLLNQLFTLGLSEQQMIDYASQLGADCPFFILSRPSYAEGIGERLEPIRLNLSGWYLAIVRPAIPVSTKDFEKSVFTLHPEIAAIKKQLCDMGALYAAMSGSGSAVFGFFQKKVALEQVFQGDEMFTCCLQL